MDQLIQDINNSFLEALPGKEAQYAMAHAFRGTYPTALADTKQAGVLILLFPKNKQWNVAFIQRPSKNPHDRHAGQLSFPGGKREAADKNLEQTAIRETTEEVGVQGDQIQILGALTQLYIPVSNFLVSPFVGYTANQPDWIPQQSEVEEIIEFPLVSFLLPGTKGTTDIKIRKELRLLNAPYFDLNGKILWGATAMMMNEFLSMSWSKQR